MKTKRNRDEQRQTRATQQKRGSGSETAYRPFIQITRNDFSSRGRSHREPSDLFERTHHVLSDLELKALSKLQLLNPADIREQFPLQLDSVEPDFSHHLEAMGTLDIARMLNVRHPQISGRLPRIMTTDFVVTERMMRRTFAVHVKPRRLLDNQRQKELRAIEETYWQQRGARFATFTEEDVNPIEVRNLELLKYRDRTVRPRASTRWLQEVTKAARAQPMNDALRIVAAASGISFEDAANRLKVAILTGRVRLDLASRDLYWSNVWPPMTVLGCEIEDGILQVELEADHDD